MRIKILNLYAGIGGNRKLWSGDIEVTAIENNPEIAKIYQDFFPNDKVIVCDAHQYLLEHYKEFDFIWSSPPCPTHSRFNNLFKEQECKSPRYPDMKLYEEIILLTYWYKGKFVVENVKSYYEPLIKPQESGNHYFWANFIISNLESVNRSIRTQFNLKDKEKKRGIDLSKYDFSDTFKKQIINNCVFPELGLHIFEMAFKKPQLTLFQKEIGEEKGK
jgi:DNA (cytosine-5)-methyltransferase 1